MSKLVTIFGGSGFLGRQIARIMAARGWRVLATCRNADDCAGLIAEGLESFPLDLASGETVDWIYTDGWLGQTLSDEGGPL